jgi:SAM-dependent methyltransferase
MDDAFRALLACPACGASLDAGWRCQGCGAAYDVPDGVPALRLPGNERTEAVRDFYTAAPFPGYPPRDSLAWLRARAGRSRFAQLLDEAIAGDARIAEIGCGTGQMSLYLARADRIVIGADLTRASLLLGAAAAKRFAVDNVMMVETDLTRPALRPGSFDLVYCSGVLHHTPDPRASFARIATLARPGGIIILGLYNAIARLPLRLRRLVARLSGGRWIPWDPVLADRATEPERREAWLRDQYRHPEEHRHTLGEVRRWFAENDVDYVRAFPSALIGEEDDAPLFVPEGDGWWLEDWLAQLGWIRSLGHEGGLFVVVGQRATSPAVRVSEPRRDAGKAELAGRCAG